MDSGPFLQKLQELFKGYDAIPLEQKKEILKNSLLLCAELRQRLVAAIHSPDSHEKVLEQRIHDLRQAIDKLSGDVQYIKGVGPRIAELLAKKGIKTIEDVLFFFPRRYEDRRIVHQISQARVGA